jgi:hypothetical protein
LQRKTHGLKPVPPIADRNDFDFLEGRKMAKGDGVNGAGQGRRNFLKAAGTAAVVLATTNDAIGKASASKSSVQRGPRPAEAVDRGLWVTWYDLPDDGRDAYLSWLHGTYLPAMLKRPGYLWAAHYYCDVLEGGAANATRFHHVDDPSVGRGYHYILLIGATDAGVFGNPIPSEIHAALPEQDRKMLALRTGERMNLFTEACRLRGKGGEVYKEGAIASPYMQMGSWICPPEYEEGMLAAYVQHRMPAICEFPSSIMMRKFNSVAGWAKHMVFYEYASKEGYDRDYDPATKKSPLTIGGQPLVPHFTHSPNGPNEAVRIWPPVRKA